MKSKMFAHDHDRTPARMKRPTPSAHAAPTLMSTPTSVRMFGWIRSATQVLMIARSGNMQMRPMSPVKRHDAGASYGAGRFASGRGRRQV